MKLSVGTTIGKLTVVSIVGERVMANCECGRRVKRARGYLAAIGKGERYADTVAQCRPCSRGGNSRKKSAVLTRRGTTRTTKQRAPLVDTTPIPQRDDWEAVISAWDNEAPV